MAALFTSRPSPDGPADVARGPGEICPLGHPCLCLKNRDHQRVHDGGNQGLHIAHGLVVQPVKVDPDEIRGRLVNGLCSICTMLSCHGSHPLHVVVGSTGRGQPAGAIHSCGGFLFTKSATSSLKLPLLRLLP